MMHAKDFEALAAALRGVVTDTNDRRETWRASVYAIGNACAASNGKFDRLKFEAAAGVPERPYLPTNTGD